MPTSVSASVPRRTQVLPDSVHIADASKKKTNQTKVALLNPKGTSCSGVVMVVGGVSRIKSVME